MSEVQSHRKFLRHHAAGCKNLEIEKNYLLRQTKAGVLQAVHGDLAMALDKIHQNLDPSDPPSPTRVFRAAMEGLDELDAKRFVLHNVLEALKRGETQQQIAQTYTRLGFIRSLSPLTSAKEASPTVGDGVAAFDSLQSMKRAGLALCQISMNAIKSIPKLVEIEPGIMLVGLVPVPTFALKGKGVTIHEPFELLRKPGHFYRDDA